MEMHSEHHEATVPQTLRISIGLQGFETRLEFCILHKGLPLRTVAADESFHLLMRKNASHQLFTL